MFFPNLDGDFVDVSGRREDGCGGSERGGRTAAGLLALGGWCSGSTARARCLFRFLGRHFFERGGLVVVLDSGLILLGFCCCAMNGREDEGTWYLGSHWKEARVEETGSCLM